MSNPIPGANGPKLFECWGETKTAKEWVKDPRCPHESPREIVRRVRNGWEPERAITQPLQYDFPPAPKYKKGRGKKVEAWGITKNLSQWSKEPFVQVSKATLTRRIAAGWDSRAALLGKPFEEEEEALKRVETPPWRRSLGEFIQLSILSKLD